MEIVIAIATPILAFLGAILGYWISALSSRKDRRHQLAMAALDKRLNTHQQAITIWISIYIGNFTMSIYSIPTVLRLARTSLIGNLMQLVMARVPWLRLARTSLIGNLNPVRLPGYAPLRLARTSLIGNLPSTKRQQMPQLRLARTSLIGNFEEKRPIPLQRSCGWRAPL